jgi:uncharacterized membrane protein YdbT with pleckstrin-like domain
MSSEPIVLQARPSIRPLFVSFFVFSAILVCPLCGLTIVLSEVLGEAAGYLYFLASLIVAAAVAKLAFDIAGFECTSYTLTESQLIEQYGVIRQKQRTLARNVSQAEIQTPFAARVFKLANLKVLGMGKDSITLKNLPNAQRWLEELKSQSTVQVDLQGRLASLRGDDEK